MKANMTFSYDASSLFELINGETSRLAAFLRYQDGGSAYDELKIHSNDQPTVNGYIADAFRGLVSRLDGDGVYAVSDSAHDVKLYLPDFDNDSYQETSDEIQRYVVLSASARWLMSRSFGEYAKMVATDAEGSMNRAIGFLRTRLSPLE